MAAFAHHQRGGTVARHLLHAARQLRRHGAAQLTHIPGDRIGSALADAAAAVQIHTGHAGLRRERKIVRTVRLGGGAALLSRETHDRFAFRRRVGQRGQQRCFAQLRGINPRQCMEVRGLAVAMGDRAGLVEQQHVHVAGHFHRLAGLGQHVGGQRPVHAGNADGRQQAADGGRNQTHQQRDQQQRIDLHTNERTDRRQRRHHHQEGQRHRRQQQGQGDLVRGLLAVRAFHQGDHPVQEAVARLGGDAHDDLVGEHLGAADHATAVGTRFAQHGGRFAGHRRFVDGGQALHDLAIGRDQFPGTDDHMVARAQFGRRDLGLAGPGMRGRQPARAEVLPGASKRGGLAPAARFGHRLGEVAEQHRQQQDRGDRQAEAQRRIAGQRDQGADHCADHHHGHHRAVQQVPGRELDDGVAQGTAPAGAIEQALAAMGRNVQRIRTHGRRSQCSVSDR